MQKVTEVRILTLQIPFVFVEPWKLKWNARIGGGGIWITLLPTSLFSHITSTHEFLSDWEEKYKYIADISECVMIIYLCTLDVSQVTDQA